MREQRLLVGAGDSAIVAVDERLAVKRGQGATAAARATERRSRGRGEHRCVCFRMRDPGTAQTFSSHARGTSAAHPWRRAVKGKICLRIVTEYSPGTHSGSRAAPQVSIRERGLTQT